MPYDFLITLFVCLSIMKLWPLDIDITDNRRGERAWDIVMLLPDKKGVKKDFMIMWCEKNFKDAQFLHSY